MADADPKPTDIVDRLYSAANLDRGLYQDLIDVLCDGATEITELRAELAVMTRQRNEALCDGAHTCRAYGPCAARASGYCPEHETPEKRGEVGS